MAITQPESGLSSGDYNDLAAARAHAHFQLIAHQWTMDFEELDAVSPDHYDGYYTFDVAILAGVPYRYFNGILERYVSNAWQTVGSQPSNPSDSNSTKTSIVESGGTLYIFIVAGSGTNNTIYRITYNGTTWGSWTQQNATTRNIEKIAASSPTVVHLIVPLTQDRYWLLTLDGGAWSDSVIYWSFPVESLSAVALDNGTHVVAMTTMTPGSVQTRVVETKVVKRVVPSGGIVAFTYKGGDYSDHIEVDLVDEWQPWRYRKHVKLSVNDGKVYALAYCRDGTKLAQIMGYRLWTTKDGINWSRGEYLQVNNDIPEFGARLYVDTTNDYCYVFTSGSLYRAKATLMVDSPHADMQLDITAWVTKGTLQQGGIVQLGCELNNQGDYFQDTILNGARTVALELYEGYSPAVGEAAIMVRTALLEVDTYDFFEGTEDGKYQNVLSLTARDRMSWMADRTQSEQFHYKDPQVIGADNYADDTESGYGGMAHTATWEGSFKTDNNKLILWSNNEEGQAASTHRIDPWNFDVQVEFQLSQVSNDEFAGFLFRAIDHKNLYRAYYNQDSDTIIVSHRVDDVDTELAESTTLSWDASPTTWRHIRLKHYYGLLYVYTSSDGVTWGAPLLTVDLPGQAALPETETEAFPDYLQQNGYVGLLGQGYNPDEEWDFDLDFDFDWDWLWEFDFDWNNYYDEGAEVETEEQVQNDSDLLPLVMSVDAGDRADMAGGVWVMDNINTRTSWRRIPVDGEPWPGTFYFESICQLYNSDGETYGLIFKQSSEGAQDGFYSCEDIYADDAMFIQIATVAESMGGYVDYADGLFYNGMFYTDPDDPNLVLFSYGGFIGRSTDRGNTWTRIDPFPADHAGWTEEEVIEGAASQSMSFHYAVGGDNSTVDKTIYAFYNFDPSGVGTTTRYIVKSTDQGLTWTKVYDITAGFNEFPDGLFCPRVRRNGDPNVGDADQELWILVENGDVGSGNMGAFRFSDDGGVTFTGIGIENHASPQTEGFVNQLYTSRNNQMGCQTDPDQFYISVLDATDPESPDNGDLTTRTAHTSNGGALWDHPLGSEVSWRGSYLADLITGNGWDIYGFGHAVHPLNPAIDVAYWEVHYQPNSFTPWQPDEGPIRITTSFGQGWREIGQKVREDASPPNELCSLRQIFWLWYPPS